MMLKASIAVITLALGVSARAETGCPAAQRTAHHAARHAATQTVIVEEHYSHAPRTPAPPYYDGSSAPPEAYAPPSADIASGAGDYYEPILTSYGYGGYGYGGYGGRSGWYSHVGGGARWGGAGAAGPTVIPGRSGFYRVRPGVVRLGPSVVRPSGFRGARVGGQAMVGGARFGGGGGGGGRR